MTLLQLRYFEALAQTLHYTRTSENLHISQPSLSYAISELEKELGVKLFQKENRKVELTIYGQQFLPYVTKSLALLKDGADSLREMRGRAPQIVRLGYFHSVSASFIPALVESFYRQEGTQGIRFQFTESSSYDILSQLQSGVLDIGFSLHQADWAESVGVIRQPLYLTVPANHPLSGCRYVSFADFAHEPQIMLEQKSNLRSNLDQIFALRGMIPNIVFEVRECNTALQYVGLGFGVSVLPHVPAMESDKVCVLPISDQDKEFVRTVYFTFRRTHPLSPAAQRVKEHIIKNYAINDPAVTASANGRH